MVVINSARDDETRSTKGRSGIELFYRALNVTLALSLAVPLWVMAGDISLKSIDSSWPARICVGIVILTGLLAGILLIRQAWKDANPVTLIVLLPAAAAFALAVDFGGDFILPSSEVLSRIRQMEILDYTMFYGAAYLLIWERGVRHSARNDDVVNAVRSIWMVWPMFLVIASLVALEYALW